MNNSLKGFTTAIFAVVASGLADASAQSVVPFGKGSIASEPPTYELVRDEWGNWNSKATLMQSKKLYVDESAPVAVDGLMVPGRPLPTNDWWTDLINRPFSGALWSYPQMLNTSETGLEICYPTYWADAGKEVKSKSSLTVGGSGFHASAAIAEDWHDWDVRFRLTSADGASSIHVTAAEGMPFTWCEFKSVTPMLSFQSRPVDTSVTSPVPSGTKAQILAQMDGRAAIVYGDDIYGVYFPERSAITENPDGTFTLSRGTKWLVVALLADAAQLDRFEQYAVSIPRDTRVDWDYNPAAGKVNTRWSVTA